MKKARPSAADEALTQALSRLVGAACWYVNGGGSAGSTFSLALGGKHRRAEPLANPHVDDAFRWYEPEYALYVWCPWRLVARGVVLATSGQDWDASQAHLRALHGAQVRDARVIGATRDLVLRFPGATLRLFGDRLGSPDGLNDNWELVAGGRAIAVDCNGIRFE